MKKRRWTCIDILKCLAAIAVVEIHKPLEIQGGDEFLILCRFAVPVFFMITGFFYPEIVEKKRELKQFGKIFTITIGANLFYLLWEILLAVEKRENIKEALLARFEERVPEDFILWNFSPLSPHLWYLQALLYVLVIAFIVEHLGLRKLAYLAIPVLLATSVSILAVPCFSCFHALVKKLLPNQNTTGVENSHIMRLAYGISIKNMPITITGTDKTMAHVVRNFSARYFLSCACSTLSGVFSSCLISKSYPAFCTACCRASGEQFWESYSTVAVAEA